MDEAYLKFLADQLANSQSDYAEPTVEELVKMMEETPLLSKKWGMFTDILVLPLSLDQYWDAFWADDAPYYVGAIERDDRDIFNN